MSLGELGSIRCGRSARFAARPGGARTHRHRRPIHWIVGLELAIFLCGLSSSAQAQLVTTLVDRDGVSLPCVTVGPLAPLAQEYCVRRTLEEGFVRRSELGWSGLTIGASGAEDGVVQAVALGSPAASAQLAPGDRILSVDDNDVRRGPASVAQHLSFGARGESVRLTIQKDGRTLERSFKRDPAPEPVNAPKSPNVLIGMHPMVNSDGLFVPCMGAGLLGPVAIATCHSHYRRDGFVRVSALGSTGLRFQDAGADAEVADVQPGSAAAKAGVRVGDRITAVDGAPLIASLGKSATALLFGKIGAHRSLRVDRNGHEVRASLTLAAAPVDTDIVH